MSGAGNCYDNAAMESFFSTLKSECATGQFDLHAQARTAIFEFIEVWIIASDYTLPWAISVLRSMSTN